MENNNGRKTDYVSKLQVLCEGTERIKFIAAYMLEDRVPINKFTTSSLPNEEQIKIVNDLNDVIYPVVVEYISEVCRAAYHGFTTIQNNGKYYKGETTQVRVTAILAEGYNYIRSNANIAIKLIERAAKLKSDKLDNVEPNHMTKMTYVAALRCAMRYCHIKDEMGINLEDENIKFYKSAYKAKIEEDEKNRVPEVREDRLLPESTKAKVNIDEVMNIASMPISEGLKLELIKEVLASIGYAVVKEVSNRSSNPKFTTDLNSIMTVLHSMGYTIEKIDNKDKEHYIETKTIGEPEVKQVEMKPEESKPKVEVIEEPKVVNSESKTKASLGIKALCDKFGIKVSAEMIDKVSTIFASKLDKLDITTKEGIEVLCDTLMVDDAVDLMITLSGKKINGNNASKIKGIIKELIQVVKINSTNVVELLSSDKLGDFINLIKESKDEITKAIKTGSLEGLIVNLMPKVTSDTKLLQLLMSSYYMTSQMLPIFKKLQSVNDDDVVGYKQGGSTKPNTLVKTDKSTVVPTTPKITTKKEPTHTEPKLSGWASRYNKIRQTHLKTANLCKDIILGTTTA